MRPLDSITGAFDQQRVMVCLYQDYCWILQMRHKAVDPVCCLMHVKEPSCTIRCTRVHAKIIFGSLRQTFFVCEIV